MLQKTGLWKITCKTAVWKDNNGNVCVFLQLNKGTGVEWNMNYGTPNPYDQNSGANYHEAILDGQSIFNCQLTNPRSLGFQNSEFSRITKIEHNDPISIIINYANDGTSSNYDGYSGHLMFEYLTDDAGSFETESSF